MIIYVIKNVFFQHRVGIFYCDFTHLTIPITIKMLNF